MVFMRSMCPYPCYAAGASFLRVIPPFKQKRWVNKNRRSSWLRLPPAVVAINLQRHRQGNQPIMLHESQSRELLRRPSNEFRIQKASPQIARCSVTFHVATCRVGFLVAVRVVPPLPQKELEAGSSRPPFGAKFRQLFSPMIPHSKIQRNPASATW